MLGERTTPVLSIKFFIANAHRNTYCVEVFMIHVCMYAEEKTSNFTQKIQFSKHILISNP